MAVYETDPLQDRRWSELVEGHPDASVFHSPAWLQALRRTYSYTPVVYTTCPPDAPLTHGVVLCRVESWITGRRLVSVPFADHCEPLVTSDRDWSQIAEVLRQEVARGWRYVELRPAMHKLPQGGPFAPATSFVLHTLDLQPPLDTILGRTHRNMIQRKIRRSARDGVRLENGRSEALLERFYGLMLLTRRRHGLPPQPMAWFRELVASFGDRLELRVASAGGRSIGAILTLRHSGTMVYKYGGSDARYHSLGAMQALLWSAIEEAKDRGLARLDLGRSDVGDEGLIAFKNHWGAAATTVTYLRHPASRSRPPSGIARAARILLARMPDRVLTTAGRLAYRHMG